MSCANLIDELKVYRWRTDSAGNVLDVPEDANDHGIDACQVISPFMLIFEHQYGDEGAFFFQTRDS